VQTQLGQTGEGAEVTVVGRVAQREQQGQSVSTHSTRHERENLGGRLVQPMGVVDDAQQRLLLCQPGQQVEHGQSDHEPVRRSSGLLTERHTESRLLRFGQRVQVAQEGTAELVEGP
jgi:hypothetical protein